MKSLNLMLALAGIGCPQLLMAQTTAYPPDPRPFFVSFRGGYSSCQMRYRTNSRIMYVDTDIFKEIPVSTIPFTLGYYLTPRLAVQLGVAYGRPTEDSPLGTMQVPGGVYSGNTHYAYQTGGVSVLSRYAIFPKSQRLQLDALLGLIWAYDSYTAYSNTTFNGVIQKEQTISDHGSQFFGTVGIGVRYSFGRHFELLYDHAWNRNLESTSHSATGNPYGLTANRALSLRYRFNWGKPEPHRAE